MKWKHFPRYWLLARGIHRSPVNFPPKGQSRGALMISLICAWINGWVNNGEAGDLRRNRAHYDVAIILFHTLTDDGTHIVFTTAKVVSIIVILEPHSTFDKIVSISIGGLFNINYGKTCKSPSYCHVLTLIPTWINNDMPRKLWDEIIYLFLDFNCCTV